MYIRAMNVTVRKQSRHKKGKSNLEEELESIFYNPKVTSLFNRGLEILDDTFKHDDVGALREDATRGGVTWWELSLSI